MAHIIVIGSGVIGLSCALDLLKNEETKSHLKKLTIVSDYFPDDADTPPLYASTRAGAHWRPMAESGGEFKSRRQFERNTYHIIMEELNKGNTFNGTIQKLRALDYYDVPPPKRLWYIPFLEKGSEIKKSRLPKGIAYGLEYDTFTIDAPKYIQYLFHQIKQVAGENGTEFEAKRQKVESVGTIHECNPSAIIINATGTGSLHISDIKDEKCYVSRGQVLLCQDKAPRIDRTISRIKENGVDYVIPRPNNGGVILGGSNWVNSYLPQVDEELSEIIKKNACALDPVMGKPEDLQVLKTSVGLRPMRVGGPRVEIDGDRTWLIHAYGLGGAGFQSSRAVAQQVSKMVRSTWKKRGVKL